MLPVGTVTRVAPLLGDAQPLPLGGLKDPGRQLPGVQLMHGVPVILAGGRTDGVGGAVHHPGVVGIIEIYA